MRDGTFLLLIGAVSTHSVWRSPEININSKIRPKRPFFKRKCPPRCTWRVPTPAPHTIRLPVRFSTRCCFPRADRAHGYRDIARGTDPCRANLAIFARFCQPIYTCKVYDANLHFLGTRHALAIDPIELRPIKGTLSILVLWVAQISAR